MTWYADNVCIVGLNQEYAFVFWSSMLLSMQDGVVRDNCFNNTFNLAEHLENKGIDKVNPLYIGSFWEEASPYIVKKVYYNTELRRLTNMTCWSY